MLPQFRRKAAIPSALIVQGATIFAIGLAKKVLLADTAAVYATPGFAEVANGTALDALTAWTAALAYTVQLYFDFSGYSDMAIGGALLFGIRLPVNFASPYKAESIIEFWRRWHVTLSRFLREYLYIPLGGNRHGNGRRYLNLFVTMLLGGLWHGAGWTYVAWGALHGLYLAINHGWRRIRARLPWLQLTAGTSEILLGRALTFLAVVVGWVFFRATDVDSAVAMLRAMAGINGLGLAQSAGKSGDALLIVALLLLAWLAPNTQELVGYQGPDGATGTNTRSESPRRSWEPSVRWALLVGCMMAFSIMSLSKISQFLYFQF
jgi:alginate O-acetyltransferase complex protein AlgI